LAGFENLPGLLLKKMALCSDEIPSRLVYPDRFQPVTLGADQKVRFRHCEPLGEAIQSIYFQWIASGFALAMTELHTFWSAPIGFDIPVTLSQTWQVLKTCQVSS
jgi:hypothetical protein